MLDFTEQLLAAIQLGEDGHLKFREMAFSSKELKGPSREAIADSLAAFANAKGGVFLSSRGGRLRPVQAPQ
jgi:ATP-dependent DNA helicase RecG